jgi:hypothetical protein
MNRFQDLVLSIPVCTTPTSIRSCTRNMLSGLLTFGSATAGPYEKRNGVQCTTGDQRIIGAKGKPIQSIFLLNGIPIEISQCPACNTHVVKKAGAIIFIAQVVDSDRYPLGDLFIFILNFSSLSDDHIFHLKLAVVVSINQAIRFQKKTWFLLLSQRCVSGYM